MDGRKEELIRGAVEKFLNGDQEQFSVVLKVLSRDIVNLAYRYTYNLEDAKDIFQEVSFKLYRSLWLFRHKSRVSTWIYRITVNTCIDFLRRKKSTLSLDERKIKVEMCSRDEDEAGGKEKKRWVAEAISLLPGKQKNAFILKHYQGLKIKEISKIMNCSHSSVKTHLFRAIRKLRKILEET